jgi:flavin reductase (DIM6/NTAB) family NADH-FMN oxidoreductase RutF
MRSVPHSVTVITTSDRVSPSPSKQSPPFEGCYGVTISSFSTVTLGPPSIITFNLRWPSRTLDAIRKQGIFRVHTLLGDAGGRDIAHAFVELAHADAFQKLASEGVAVSTAPNNNTTSPRAEAAVGDAIPTIHGPGVMASLLCKAIPEKCVEIGDHIVIIAEVLTINTAERGHDSNQQSPPGQQSLADRDLRDDGEVDYGLLYVQQRYGSPNVSWGVDENEDEDSSER